MKKRMLSYQILHKGSQRFVWLLLALLAGSPAWSQQPLQVQEQQGINFVSGGFGQEERAQLQAMAGQFNLKLVFTVDAGNFLAGVDVRIMDQQDNALVTTRSDGPILMADLPVGTYLVAADHKGNEKKQTVDIGGRGMAEVTFTWPAE